MGNPKKKNPAGVVILVIVVLAVVGLGIFMLYDKVWKTDDPTGSSGTGTTQKTDTTQSTGIDSAAELSYLNGQLTDFSRPLGWVALVSGFSKEPYALDKNTDLLTEEPARQLFVMEYLLNDSANFSRFVVLAGESQQVDSQAVPTDDMTLAYMKYEDFNTTYRKFFDKDFDTAKALSGNTSYDTNGYVYYQNRRIGSNGVSVVSMTATAVTRDSASQTYTATVTVTYSERAAENLGYAADTAELTYRKGSDSRLVLQSFTLK